MHKTNFIDYSSNIQFMNTLKYNHRFVNEFLSKGQIDPNFIDKYGASPLFYAIINKNRYIDHLHFPSPAQVKEAGSQVKKLIAMGADVNLYFNANLCKEAGESNLLILAARHKSPDFKLILEASNIDINFKQANGLTAAQACMRSGFIEGLKLLISKGAIIDSLAFNEVHKSHQWPCFELLVKNDVPYHENEKGQNLLHVIAQQQKYFLTFEVCIRHLANKGFINQVDKEGNTPLFYALQTNNHKIINQFILNGADLSAVCQGFTLYDYVDKLLLELEGSAEKIIYQDTIPIIRASKMKNDLEKTIPHTVDKSLPSLKFKV